MRGNLSSVEVSTVHQTQPPPVRSEWVDRPRLRWRLERALRSQVVLIAAPAGYGKTTLLTQWAAGHDGSAVAWVDLDRADNDPTRLWAHLAVTLDRVGCAVDVNAVEFVAANATAIAGRVIPRVAHALADHGRPLTLVFEDVHMLRTTECCEQLERLIGLLPASVTVVLASRSDRRCDWAGYGSRAGSQRSVLLTWRSLCPRRQCCWPGTTPACPTAW